ncbi:putative transposase [Cedecea sp. NFIX57]|nr:putative transposase [Cedecea sp. NFIX57]
MEHNVRNRLDKIASNSPELRRRRTGTKAFEYHVDCLPAAVREVVLARRAEAVLQKPEVQEQLPLEPAVPAVKGHAERLRVSVELEVMRKCPALLERQLGSLTDKQRKTGDARMTLVAEVRRLMGELSMSRKDAVTLISARSREGTLPERVQQAADIANARKGVTRTGVSVRSLQQWVSDAMTTRTAGERMAIMAPAKIKAKPAEAYPWLSDFMRFYRDPARPSVAMAYERFEAEWYLVNAGNEVMLSMLPRVDTVRYALSKIPKAERERGRRTGSDYKSLLPHVRRDWEKLSANSVWIGDGHGMKMEVINPATGKPFRPEVTLVIDGRTRVVVGWSLAVSESQIAVGDAIRNAITHYGVPLMYYSDNGGGEKNKVFDADVTGIFSRLEIEHPTGIPGNPQARGIIERLNQEIPKRAAMKFGSWVGKSGDRETQRKYVKAVESAVTAIENGKELNERQVAAMRKVPTWEQLIEEIGRQMERHNNRPHSSLPVRENGECWSPLAYRNHVLKEEKTDIEMLTTAELHEMFRPEKICTAVRGEVQLFRNIYFSTELSRVEGEKVRVCYDIHDPQTVIIRHMDGSWICDAIWNGNKVSAFPEAREAQLKEKRVRRSVKKMEDKIRRRKEELRPAIELKPEIDISLFSAPNSNKEPDQVYLFESDYEHDLKKAGNHR